MGVGGGRLLTAHRRHFEVVGESVAVESGRAEVRLDAVVRELLADIAGRGPRPHPVHRLALQVVLLRAEVPHPWA